MKLAFSKLLEKQTRIQPVATKAVTGMKKSRLVTIISLLCMQSHYGSSKRGEYVEYHQCVQAGIITYALHYLGLIHSNEPSLRIQTV